MKVSIKLLLVGFLLASSGLLEAANTITNKTGQSIRISGESDGVGAWGGNGDNMIINNNASYTIPSIDTSISFIYLSAPCHTVGCGQTFSISPNTSYNLILGPDNTTLVLSPIVSGSKFAPGMPKGGKPGK